jgi:hypothetical protein
MEQVVQMHVNAAPRRAGNVECRSRPPHPSVVNAWHVNFSTCSFRYSFYSSFFFKHNTVINSMLLTEEVRSRPGFFI